MGAIARNIANNITTAGVFTPSALNSSSVTGITVLANASDGITFISSQTASNSASVSFTTGITSTYKAYKFVFSNIHARTDNTQLTFNLSTDSGSNYNVTKTSSFFRAYQSEDGTDQNLGYQGAFDLAQSTSNQPVTNSLGSDADEVCGGSMILFNPSSTTYVKHFIARTNINEQSNYTMEANTAGYGNTTSAINAIRFQMSSGNFDGTIYLYGIK
jgi:hypothetical protein